MLPVRRALRSAIKRFGGAPWRLLDKLVPKRPRAIAVCAFPDFDDTTHAFAKEALDSGRTLYVLTTRAGVSVPHALRHPNIRIAYRYSLTGIWNYHRSPVVVFTHGLFSSWPTSKRQTVVNVWHGMPIKRIGLLDNKSPDDIPKFDFTIASDSRFSKIVSQAFGVSEKKVLLAHHPRLDMLTRPATEWRNRLPRHTRLAVWLPTYRVSMTGDVRLDGDAQAADIVGGSVDLGRIDEVLSQHGALCIVKPHPMTKADPSAFTKYRSLKLIQDEELSRADVTLYQVLGASDLLITDVSSAYFDYSVLRRPRILYCPDLETYAATRGFVAPIETLVEDPVLTSEPDFLRALSATLSGMLPVELAERGGLSATHTLLKAVEHRAGERGRNAGVVVYVNRSPRLYRIPTILAMARGYRARGMNFLLAIDASAPDHVEKNYLSRHPEVRRFRSFVVRDQEGFRSRWFNLVFSVPFFLACLRIRPRVIIQEGVGGWGVLSPLLKILFGTRIVVSFERTETTEMNAAALKVAYQRLYFRMFVDRVVVNGSRTARLVRTRFGYTADLRLGNLLPYVPRSSRSLLPDPVAGEARDVPRVLVVMQMIERKGVDRLVRVLRGLVPERPALWTIIGTGELESQLDFLAAEPTVRRIRRVAQEDVYDYYRAFDYFLLPTREDNWSLAVHEAMCCGMVPITSVENGLVPDIVDSLSGHILDFDAPEIIDDIREVLARGPIRGTARDKQAARARRGGCHLRIGSHFVL